MQYFVLKPVQIASDWLTAHESELRVEEALGAVAARDVVSRVDIPNYTSALRDGWAVSTKDDPKTREKAGWSVENGQTRRRLPRGQAVWVNTGGIVPEGADAVIASVNELDRAAFRAHALAGDNIELQGCDWKAGEVLVSAGTRIGAREMALLFEAGVETVSVYAAPVVGIVATGSEMVDRASGLKSGKRRCSNASYIEALMRRIGVKDLRLRVLEDDPERIAAVLRDLSRACDIIVTIGGTGRGKRDYTSRAAALAGGVGLDAGANSDSPFVLARLGRAAMIGLPGNPLGAMMMVQRILLDRIRKAFYLPERPLETVKAVIDAEIEAGCAGDLCVTLKRTSQGLVASPIQKGTGRMRVFESACGAVVLAEGGIAAGGEVSVELFSN